jgi:ribosomal protein S18 acetylase RimI-like enzyme
MLNYKQGNTSDITNLKQLAIKSWQQFQTELTNENWERLSSVISTEKTFSDLLEISHCIICETDKKEIIGMAFIVPSGNPSDIFEKEWSVIRFVSVNPEYRGQGIGRKLTEMCIDYAKTTNEKIIALHTSEMMNNARHIYESLGFKILKEIEPRLGKKYWLYTLEVSK